MSQVFALEVPVWEILLRAVAVYLALAVLVRVAGKRGLAHLNTFDLVVVLLIANTVANAIIGEDTSVTGGVLAAGVLIAVNAAVVRIVARSDRLTRLFEGTPTTLVEHGRWVTSALRREGLRTGDIATALRAQNADGVADVERAVLEPGGSLVVTLRRDEQPADHGDVAGLHRRLEEVESRLLAAVNEMRSVSAASDDPPHQP
ncbi:MAG: DUF421 domain-containing protein [Pseudonocardia sp.]